MLEAPVISEAELRQVIKQEIARLIDGRLTAEEIEDDEPLYSVPGTRASRIELDSLDALELSFAIEQAIGTEAQPDVPPEQPLTVDALLILIRGTLSQPSSKQ